MNWDKRFVDGKVAHRRRHGIGAKVHARVRPKAPTSVVALSTAASTTAPIRPPWKTRQLPCVLRGGHRCHGHGPFTSVFPTRRHRGPTRRAWTMVAGTINGVPAVMAPAHWQGAGRDPAGASCGRRQMGVNKAKPARARRATSRAKMPLAPSLCRTRCHHRAADRAQHQATIHYVKTPIGAPTSA